MTPSSRRARCLVGVVGAAAGTPQDHAHAYAVGASIARAGWLLVCGGLGGVMHHASRGAVEAGGDVLGLLPGATADSANPYVTIPVPTNMGHARNVIIAHTATALIAIGGAEGTLSEIAIALKLGKLVISLGSWHVDPRIVVADSPDAAIAALAQQLSPR